MANVITRSLTPDLLWPGVHKIFGYDYESFPTVYTQIFDKQAGELATERLVELVGFGLAKNQTESGSVEYDTDGEGYVTEAVYNVFGLAYQVTREELEDMVYKEVAGRRAKALARSMAVTAEHVHANLFLNSFNSAYQFGDLQPLISTAHPVFGGGTQSNKAVIAADLSEDAIEDMCKDIYTAKDARGLEISIMPKQLIVGPNDMFNADRILQSQLRTGSANNGSNEINALKNMNMLSGGAIVNPYFGFDNGGAWWIQTNIEASEGLLSLWKREPDFVRDNEFNTQNLRAQATMRFLATVANWRCLYGNAGE